MRVALRNRFVRRASALGLLGWCLGDKAWAGDDLPRGADVVTGDISIATDGSDLAITQGTKTGVSWLGDAYAVSLGERDHNVINEGRLSFNASLGFAGEATAQTERGDARFFLSASLNY